MVSRNMVARNYLFFAAFAKFTAAEFSLTAGPFDGFDVRYNSAPARIRGR